MQALRVRETIISISDENRDGYPDILDVRNFERVARIINLTVLGNAYGDECARLIRFTVCTIKSDVSSFPRS